MRQNDLRRGTAATVILFFVSMGVSCRTWAVAEDSGIAIAASASLINELLGLPEVKDAVRSKMEREVVANTKIMLDCLNLHCMPCPSNKDALLTLQANGSLGFHAQNPKPILASTNVLGHGSFESQIRLTVSSGRVSVADDSEFNINANVDQVVSTRGINRPLLRSLADNQLQRKKGAIENGILDRIKQEVYSGLNLGQQFQSFQFQSSSTHLSAFTQRGSSPCLKPSSPDLYLSISKDEINAILKLYNGKIDPKKNKPLEILETKVSFATLHYWLDDAGLKMQVDFFKDNAQVQHTLLFTVTVSKNLLIVSTLSTPGAADLNKELRALPIHFPARIEFTCLQDIQKQLEPLKQLKLEVEPLEPSIPNPSNAKSKPSNPPPFPQFQVPSDPLGKAIFSHLLHLDVENLSLDQNGLRLSLRIPTKH